MIRITITASMTVNPSRCIRRVAAKQFENGITLQAILPMMEQASFRARRAD
jgi:hypothetical protein